MTDRALVTGGAGYFGEILSQSLLAKGYQVRVLDLNPPGFSHPNLEAVQADIRDAKAVAAACEGVRVVHHNVAQVPLAKDKDQFFSVNEGGVKIMLAAAKDAGVGKVVYTSSSAVFGAPKTLPVTEATVPTPAEAYGHAKLAGEVLCRTAAENGLDVSIIRPRTILGHGRLGVVQLLFDWIEKGAPVPVFDGGRNIYQFVHAEDLAAACIAAGERPGFSIYNIGAKRFGTMRELLEALIAHAGSKSRIKSVPMAVAETLMNAASAAGFSPLGPYHALMYGRSLYFDIGAAERELGYAPRYSCEEALIQSYDWYISHRDTLDAQSGRSHHQSKLKQGALAMAPVFLGMLP